MRSRTRKLASALAGVVAATTVVLPSSAAAADSMTDPCRDVEAVFARGSGQEVGGPQANRWSEQLFRRIKSPIGLNVYELGQDEATGGYGGHSYEAIDVNNPLNGNPGGAKMSSGYGFDYGRSVDSGVGELYNYLLQRQARCTTSRFVLGGFSQGAQVIGQTVEKLASEKPGALDRVDFAAMFGDPKLYLPEGEGIWPAACRGGEMSPWRRTVPECDTDNGSLGARKPYVPSVMRTKSGLWCYDKDFVCGSTKNPLQFDGHTYFDDGGAIDDAALEIARLIKKTVPEEDASGIDDRHDLGAGTTGLDVAFVIDTTGSMGGYIEEAKAFASDMAASIEELRGRVALIAYKDAGDPYTAHIFSGLQGDVSHFQAQLDTLTPSGGGDTPEALLHALTTTLNGLEWRPGATKAAVVLTDAGFHEPDRVDGSTVDSVAARALEIDPVNVYPIVPSFLVDDYQELAELTTGQVIDNSGDVSTSLEEALTRLRNRPVPLLALPEYYGQPGEQFIFDASRSYVIGSTIDSYDWDFDGDGVFDLSTTTPVAEHVYADVFDGVMQVRLQAADGGVANASAFVHVSNEPPVDDRPVAPALTMEVLSTSGGTSSVQLAWEPADERSAYWGVSVNGVPIGLVEGDVTSVEITDVERSDEVEFGVAGLTAERLEGRWATVALQGLSTPRDSGGGPAPAPDDATDEEECAAFSDLEDSNVHYEEVCQLVRRGWLRGYVDGTFRPGLSVSRGQVAAVLARVAGLEPSSAESPFTDTAGTTHDADIRAAAEAGFIHGFADGSFRPNDPVHRDQLASILGRWLDVEPVAEGPFRDVAVGSVHAGLINALHELGVIEGTTSTTFGPFQPARRDQFAALVDRAR